MVDPFEPGEIETLTVEEAADRLEESGYDREAALAIAQVMKGEAEFTEPVS